MKKNVSLFKVSQLSNPNSMHKVKILLPLVARILNPEEELDSVDKITEVFSLILKENISGRVLLKDLREGSEQKLDQILAQEFNQEEITHSLMKDKIDVVLAEFKRLKLAIPPQSANEVRKILESLFLDSTHVFKAHSVQTHHLIVANPAVQVSKLVKAAT